MNQNLVDTLEKELSEELNEQREKVLKEVAFVLCEEKTIQQFHAIIGSKNNTYVDIVNTKFPDFSDFYGRWLKGLNDTYQREKNEILAKNGYIEKLSKSSFRQVALQQNILIREYTKIFLMRNFYRNLRERTRDKPAKELWQNWFGENNKLMYGIFIAPVKRGDEWTNDVSEIRRTTYNYWTINHILSTGMIDENMNKPYKFHSLADVIQFYESTLAQLSNPHYERKFIEKYIAYLQNSKNPGDEPLLIPELRFAGKEKKHNYRLDFTILNSHTMDFIGFEISPASTHMSIANLKSKQKEANEELKMNWEKEIDKRNAYFKQFGITTITFTDEKLKNIDDCFHEITHFLQKRPAAPISINYELERLTKFS